MSNFKKKKILFVSTRPVTLKVFLKELIYILDKDIDVEILTNTKFLNRENKIKNINYKHIPFERNISLFLDFFCLIKMIIFLNKKKYDCIFSITPKAGLISSIASFIIGVRTRIHIFTGQVWSNKNFIFKSFLKIFDKIICYFANNILCDSRSQKKYLYLNRLTKKKILTLGRGSICGVNTKNFSKTSNIKQIRKKLKINPNLLTFIYVGRLHPDKGIDLLLRSIKNIAKNKIKFQLLLVGDDEINIKNLMKKKYNSIQNVISIYPFTNNINKFLQASDIFVFPSYREGFGVSVVEALSCGLPVIVSDIYGLKDSFQHNINGLRFKNGNQQSLEKSMTLLLKDKKLRKKLSSKSRSFVLENFEQTKVINKYKKYIMKKI